MRALIWMAWNGIRRGDPVPFRLCGKRLIDGHLCGSPALHGARRCVHHKPPVLSEFR